MTADEREKRETRIVYLQEIYANQADIVEEYIAEAEHQEGYTYWMQFPDLQELATDFDLYRENRV
jgi:hypothetical protein